MDTTQKKFRKSGSSSVSSVYESTEQIRILRKGIEKAEQELAYGMAHHRAYLCSFRQEVLRNLNLKILHGQRAKLWRSTFFFQGLLYQVNTRILRIPVMLCCLVFALGFYAFSAVAIFHNLWIFYPPLLGIFWLSYIVSAWCLPSTYRKQICSQTGNLESIRFWLFSQYMPGEKFPNVGNATSKLSTLEWTEFNPYCWRFSEQPDFKRSPLLLEIWGNEGAELACFHIQKNRSEGAALVFNKMQLDANSCAILSESVAEAVEGLPVGCEDSMQSDVNEQQKLSERRKTLRQCEEAVELMDETSKIWNQIYLTEKLEKSVKRRSDSFNMAANSLSGPLLITGPEGSGKTLLVDTIEETCAHFCLSNDAEDFWQYNQGPVARSKEVWDALMRNGGRGLLIIDGIDRLLYSGIEEEGTMKANFLRSFIDSWNDVARAGKVWVVATARDRTRIHREALSRFAVVEGLGRLDPEGVKFVAEKALRKFAKEMALDEPCIKILQPFTPGVISRIIEKAVEKARPGDPTPRDVREAASNYLADQGTQVDPTATWDALILHEETKQDLKILMKQLRNAEDYLKEGFNVPRGVLLHGPPGTGKTQIARTLATESGLSFQAVTVADLKAEYVGQSAPKTKKVFDEARSKHPCILFIDEIDSCAGRRDESDSFNDEVVTQMLTEMDGAAEKEGLVFVVGATNQYSAIDSAVLSRFNEKIEIPLPGEQECQDLLRLFLSKSTLSFELEEALPGLAAQFKGMSGRDLQTLIERAQRRVIKRHAESDAGTLALTLEDLTQAQDRKSISVEDLDKIWRKIVLPTTVENKLLRMVKLFNANSPASPKGTLLYGPPGTGKSLIAKRLAESCNCEFISLNTADLKGRYIGEGADKTKKVWERAREAGKALIFLDECDALFATRGSMESDSYSKDVVSTFLAEWDGVASSGRVWVVGATNRKDVLDTAILQRFGESIKVPEPDGAARCKILQLELDKNGVSVEVPPSLGSETSGFSGRALSKLADQIVGIADGGTPTPDHIQKAITEIRSSQSTATSEGASWNSLIVSDALLEDLKEIGLTLKKLDYFVKYGLDLPTGLLLYGPPGTGKTQIARTLAMESGVFFLAATTADVKGQYIGESGQKTKQLFAKAREMSPCILFLDEVDAILPDRHSPHDSFAGEIVQQALQELDGVKAKDGIVYLVAATNHPDRIEPAIRSRFAKEVEVPLPQEEDRRRMLDVFVGEFSCEFDRDTWIEQAAARTEGLSGRDLNTMVKAAKQKAGLRGIDSGQEAPPVLTLGDFEK